MNLKTKAKKKVTLNLTSLIDVLFILIIFFSVSSTFLEQPGIELNLPKAESSSNFTAQKIIIYADKDKNIFLNNEMIAFEQLAGTVKELYNKHKDQSIILKADSRVSHGLIIEIMDKLRNQGLYKIVISTDQAQEG